MLRVRLDINGSQISEVKIVNQGEKDVAGFTKYKVYDENDEHVETVWHNRDDGAVKLAQMALNKIDNQYGKES